MAAVGAANASKAEVEVAAGEEFADDLADDWAPPSVTLLVSLAVRPLKFGIKPLHKLVQWREPGLAWTVDRTVLGGANHNRHAVARFWGRNEETLDPRVDNITIRLYTIPVKQKEKWKAPTGDRPGSTVTGCSDRKTSTNCSGECSDRSRRNRPI